MHEIIIDFAKYSSLRIGTKNHVMVLELQDLKACLQNYEDSKSSENLIANHSCNAKTLKNPLSKDCFNPTDSINKEKNKRDLAHQNKIKTKNLNMNTEDSIKSLTHNLDDTQYYINQAIDTSNQSNTTHSIQRESINTQMQTNNATLKPHKPTLLTNQTLQCLYVFESSLTSYITIDSLNLHVIGKANNLLVSPNAHNLAIFGNSFNYISVLPDYIEMGASVASNHAFSFFKQHNLSGLEFLQNLPGNIGALCNMNAGMKQYEMKNIIASLNINGEWIDKEKAQLQYRHRESKGVIFAVRFLKQQGFRTELLQVFQKMRANHPKNASCGSCFKNPPNNYAGKLLEEAGLKGYNRNGVGFSEQHANFLVNLGGATFEDALFVIQYAQQKVFQKCQIMLECEVKICD